MNQSNFEVGKNSLQSFACFYNEKEVVWSDKNKIKDNFK